MRRTGREEEPAKRALRGLQEVLKAQNINPDSESFTLAGSCLSAAFKVSRNPTCGARREGMFISTYAPHLPMAIVEIETNRKRDY